MQFKFSVETSKPGHPVSRTGSDRRPDAVREESSRTQDGQEQQDRTESEPVHQDRSVKHFKYCFFTFFLVIP